LKEDMGRRRVGEEGYGRRANGHGNSGGRGFAFSRWGGRSRSDNVSWRKDGSNSSGDKGGRVGSGEEVGRGKPKQLCEVIDKVPEGGDGTAKENEGVLVVFEKQDDLGKGQEMDVEGFGGDKIVGEMEGQNERSMHDAKHVVGGGLEKTAANTKNGKKFKRLIQENNPSVGEGVANDNLLGKKRGLVTEEAEQLTKKGRSQGDFTEVMTTTTSRSAGLYVQPRREQ
jgi:hypothetical protein